MFGQQRNCNVSEVGFWANPVQRLGFGRVPAGARAMPVMSTLFASLDGMLFRCLVDAGRTLLSVSPGCRELTGYAAEDLMGSSRLASLTHSEDVAAVRGTILAALDIGAHYRIEYRIVGRDGAEKWVRERGIGLRDEAGRRIVEAYLEDITDCVQAMIQLAETELRYRSIFENSVIGMFQSTENGRYLAANQALATLYRYPTPEALISSLADIASGLYVDRQRRADFKRLIQRDGRVREFESEVICHDPCRLRPGWHAAVLRRHGRGHHRTPALPVGITPPGDARSADRPAQSQPAAGSPATGRATGPAPGQQGRAGFCRPR